MLSLSVQLRRAAYVMFNDGWQSKTLATEAADTIDRMASAIADDNREMRRLNDEIAALTRELAEAREAALEEAAAFIDAHAALEEAGICDLSGMSDPPLTKTAEKSVFEANARKSAQAATYKAIAAHFRALKEKP